jgi:hypothetical protein
MSTCEESGIPSKPPELAEMPNLWIGVALTAIAVAVEIVWASRLPPSLPLQLAPVPPWLIVAQLAPSLYWLYSVKQFHEAIWAAPGYNHTITPSRAVAMHFIPFFNLYWVFRWPSEIARFVNWRTQSQSMRGWVAGIAVVATFLLGRLFGNLALFALYGAGFYVSRHMKRALSAPEVPDSARESMVPGMLKLS